MAASAYCFQCGSAEHASWACTVRPARAHKILCSHMLDAGRCPFGSKCNFAHDAVPPHLRGTAAGRAVAAAMPGKRYAAPPPASAGWGSPPAQPPAQSGWGAPPAPAPTGWGAPTPEAYRRAPVRKAWAPSAAPAPAPASDLDALL